MLVMKTREQSLIAERHKMFSFQDLPRELQTRVVGLLSSSCLLEDSSSPEDAEDFLEVARGQNFGHLARAALVCRCRPCVQ